MKTYFTSDLHLGHEKVIEYCKRPFASGPEMDEALIANWNAVVSPEDTIWVLGDVCFHKPRYGVPLLQRLQGKKHLVLGNHDHYSMSQYREAGFLSVMLECRLRLKGFSVTLSHFPYWSDLEAKEDDRYPERRPLARGGWLFCGHAHERFQVRKPMVNVGVDVWAYKPVCDEQLLQTMRASAL